MDEMLTTCGILAVIWAVLGMASIVLAWLRDRLCNWCEGHSSLTRPSAAQPASSPGQRADGICVSISMATSTDFSGCNQWK